MTCIARKFKPRRRKPVAEWFWSKVEKTEGCWLWTGNKGQDGYGRLTVRDEQGRRKNVLASRLGYELQVGPLSPDEDVLHRCDTPACVRGDHLFKGTHSDNIRDAVNKGRHWTPFKGTRSPWAKLNEEKVREIRRRYIPGENGQVLADEFGVSACTIRDVGIGRTWKHVKGGEL